MKLTELDPRWYTLDESGKIAGITFDCPHCKKERLGIPFHHNGHEAMDDAYIRAHNPSASQIWTMTGNDFSDVTFSPSIDASHCGHWHGFVTNGEIA
jgi:hypothetical protein